MNISQIIDAAISISISSQQKTQENENLFLLYFNIACRELVKETAGLNDSLKIIENYPEQDTSANLVLNKDPSVVKLVIDSKKPLYTYIESGFDEFHYIRLNKLGFGGYYMIKNKTLSFLNNYNYRIEPVISYVPSFENLLITSPTNSIPCPSDFRNLLIKGTLFYYYQDLDGVKSSNKEQINMNEWYKGISQLKNYLSNKKESYRNNINTRQIRFRNLNNSFMYSV